jgi:membrane protease YdiL (CAAX protease family)
MGAAGLATGWTLLPGLASVILWVGDGLGFSGPWPRGGGHGPAHLAATVVLAPLFEEIVYRDRLLPALVARVGRGPGLLLSSAAFALPHATPWAILGSFGAGLVLGGTMLAGRNNLGLCVGIHAGLNLRLAFL